MRSKFTHENLGIISELLEDIDPSFESFTIDKLWNKVGDKLTVCFTCEKLVVPKEKKEKQIVRY